MTTKTAMVTLVAAIGLALASPAQAQFGARLSIRLEGGYGAMLPEYQNDMLGQETLLEGAARIGIRLGGPLVLQAGYLTWFAPSDLGDAQQHSIEGGLRIEPMLGSFGYLVIDGNAGLGITGEKNRFTIDASLGLEFALSRNIAIGPCGRYGNTSPTEHYFPPDALMIVGGLSLTIRGAEREEEPAPPPPPPDQDSDGVVDADDVCPSEPMGINPDPERRGCPLSDRDRDTVFDRDDLCPDEAQGETPDPARRGCPAGDSDSDGVVDPRDECPTTMQGETPDPTRPGCPDPDNDGDGITNSRDECPLEHAGLNPDPARAGCPLPDRDHDTIPDPTDACPDEAGAPSTDPQRNGCPGLVVIEGGQIRILRPVFFNTNRDTIRRSSRPVLEAVAMALQQTPAIRKISIEGHTDDVGDDARNMDLSQRRADSVMAALVELGVEPGRLEAHGYGETRPIMQGTNRQARAANRRVEFVIIDPAQQQQREAGSLEQPPPGTQ
jgi:outer membrane protein OmpA-like peptidoglycan-associated protein